MAYKCQSDIFKMEIKEVLAAEDRQLKASMIGHKYVNVPENLS